MTQINDGMITHLEPDILECEVKWALEIAENRREVKSKGEKERYTHLNAEFQRMARRDKSLPQGSMQRNRGKQQNGKD